MFNRQCICIECSEKERTKEEFKLAVKADDEEIKKGNLNFDGIGFRDNSRK